MADYQQEVAQNPIFGKLKDRWGWILALGIIFLILGIIGLSMTFGLTMASMVFFGVLLLIGGVLQFVDAFKYRNWKGILWHIFISLLYIAGGVVVIFNPAIASTIFTAIIAFMLVLVGISRIIMSLLMKGEQGWIWVFLVGLVSLILGIIILSHWPVSGLWVIGLFIAIELIVSGWSYICIALAARKA